MPAPQIEYWPALPLKEWEETYTLLHRLTQIIGKIRLRLAPHVNHWWQVPLYVTPLGLTTSSIPYDRRAFEMVLNLKDHQIVFHSSGEDEWTRSVPLSPRPVAEFYDLLMDELRSLNIDVRIWPVPVEIDHPVPFKEDRTRRLYDAEYANRLRLVLIASDRVLQIFRSRFIGKCSPVHYFWGGFDMAVTRFSGRKASSAHPPMANVAHFVVLEAYSHEVSSCGFWPGGGAVQEPVYYAYAYPEPERFKDYPIRPASAYYSPEMGEFLLPYEAVRRAENPERELLSFLQSTYEAAAETGGWDRANLERTAL
jgi:hypothetical protein